MRVLIANRGEIAIRIARAADDLGLETVAVFAQDDAGALHTRRASLARALPGSGVAAYLDMTSLIAIARDTQCRWVHPGYGFLAENPRFAQACEAADLVFVGPDPHSLGLFGDKLRARARWPSRWACRCCRAPPRPPRWPARKPSWPRTPERP
jgi:acetyl/propionyl-CoA carboxylase alpha subunit